MFEEIDRLFSQARFDQLAKLIALKGGQETLAGLPDLAALQGAIACSICGFESQAERLFGLLLERNPAAADLQLNLGVFRLQQKRYLEAQELLVAFLGQRPGDANGVYNLALVEFALSNFRTAANLLGHYLAYAPNDPGARLYMARCAMEVGDTIAAEQLAFGLRRESFQGIREFYEFARLQSALDQREAAEATYQWITRQFPDELPARINLAQLYERANRIDEANQVLGEAEAQGASTHHYWLIRARLQAAAGRHAEALESLERAVSLLPDDLAVPERQSLMSELQFERGQCLDKLNRCEDAYTAFTLGNDLVRDRYRQVVGHVEAELEPSWYRDDPHLDSIVNQRRRQQPAADTPVFLVGFPRSGTTLLDQVLDGHPQLQVMEEKPALENVALTLESRFGSVADGLMRANDQIHTEMQAVYHSTVAHYLRREAGTYLVDKYPLSIARLQLGMALFPRLKWIFAVRHPCDVVLSCFMQNFRFTNSTQGFWDLEQTANIYIRTMTLWLDQRDRLKPECLDIHYEEVVADFEVQARRLIEFLQLPWDERVLRYREHARTRRIGTPSYRQVVQPIYKTAQGRWTRYRQQLAPLLPRLAPLAHRLGYSVELDASA